MTSLATQAGAGLRVPCMSRQLEASTAARWRTRIAGPDEGLRHWRTRVGYYRAAVTALGQSNMGEVDVHHIVRHHERGRSSTVYAVAARHTLSRAYRLEQRPAVQRLADLIPVGPAAQVIAEAKVWSFWPARQAWLRELDECYPTGAMEVVGPGMVRALAQWWEAQPTLARAYDGLPPLCAVEDLMILSRNTLSAASAARLLMDAVSSGELEIPPGVPRPRCPALDDVLVSAVARIDTAVELLRAPPGGTGEQGAAMTLLRAAARDLTNLHHEPKGT